MKTSLLVLLSLISLITAQECPPGTYKDKRKCKDCPAGTYNAFAGAQGIDLCRPCPTGTFNSLPGQSSVKACKPCPDNRSSTSGSAKCILCPPGSFIEPQNSAIPKCKPCRIGTFTDKPNLIKCTDCPESQVAPVGSSSCKSCMTAGRGPSDNKSKCEKCTLYEYNDGTLNDCESCPFGLQTNKKRGATRCIPCPSGRAMATRFSRTCSETCGPGENRVKSRPLCVKDGTPCPSNYFEDKEGVCRTCTTLQCYKSRRKKCLPCPKGTRSGGNLDTKCVPCPKGKVLVGDRCVCPEGFSGPEIGTCTICPAGTRWQRRLRGLGVCARCQRGTFSSKEGSLKCEVCPPELAQPEDGQKSCVKCPEGLIASTLSSKDYGSSALFDNPPGGFFVDRDEDITRSACVSPQTNCPPGLERVVDGMGKLFCQAASCPADTVEILKRPTGFGLVKVRLCLNCPIGTFLDRDDGRCRLCKITEYSKGGLVSECTPCPNNYYRNRLLGGTQKCICETVNFGRKPRQVRLLPDGRCVKCPRGTTGNVGTTICTPCPAGTTEGFNGCFTCRAGSFTNVTGTTSVGPTVSDCEKCPIGTTTYGVGETECVPIGGRYQTRAIDNTSVNDGINSDVRSRLKRVSPSRTSL